MTKKRIDKPEEKLIEAATSIIEMEGLDYLSARAVSFKANCSVGTLYNYFKDMNELVLKINGRTLLKLKDAILRAILRVQDKKALGKALAKEYLGFAESNLPFWNLLFHYKLPKGQVLPLWYKTIIDENFKLLESALIPHVGVKNVHKASRVLWGACHGIILLSMGGKLEVASPDTAELLCESLFENYLNGFK